MPRMVERPALYRDGKASVMFLDLTMPDMSGYQVLETLRHEDLNTFVIVVSADIQPQAQARVRELGAIAFVAKPVTSGIAACPFSGVWVVCLVFTAEQRDALQEIANLAMGRAPRCCSGTSSSCRCRACGS